MKEINGHQPEPRQSANQDFMRSLDQLEDLLEEDQMEKDLVAATIDLLRAKALKAKALKIKAGELKAEDDQPAN
ncbi:MAG: hypothetical protein WA885_23725 [Phormidesmis sp.]